MFDNSFFGNIFETDNLTKMLAESRARRKFVERPALVIPKDCIECDYLSLCHGGCPVRTFTFSGTMFEKDPYCHVYLAMFRKAEDVAAKLAGERARPGYRFVPKGFVGQRAATEAVQVDGLPLPGRLNLVQIERR